MVGLTSSTSRWFPIWSATISHLVLSSSSLKMVMCRGQVPFILEWSVIKFSKMTVREEKFYEKIFSQIEIIVPIPKLLNLLQNVVIVHELEDRHNADPSTADVDPLPVGVEEDLGPGVVVHADQFDLLLEDELPSLVVEAVDLQQGYKTIQSLGRETWRKFSSSQTTRARLLSGTRSM